MDFSKLDKQISDSPFSDNTTPADASSDCPGYDEGPDLIFPAKPSVKEEQKNENSCEPFDLNVHDASLDESAQAEYEDATESFDISAYRPDYEEIPGDDASFTQAYQAKPKKKTVTPHSYPVKKGRPRRKKGEGMLGIPNILVTLVWLSIIIAIGVTLGRMLWVCASDVLAFGREEKKVTITVYESDTIEQITDKLYRGGLIRYPGLFKLYAKFAVDEGEIHPGIWDLNTLYDYHALVRMMSPSSTREVVKVMIPEGYSCRQIFDLLQDNKVATAVDLAAYAATGELSDYWFLDGIERGDNYCLEGFLFPDTYEFYTNESPKNVLEKMLNNFDKRFDDEMKDQIPVLNELLTKMMRSDGKSEEFIEANQFGIKEIIIVASMVERETANAKEGYTVASVIYNRLFKWGKNPSYLNIDATIVYALDGKNNLTTADLQIDHPYNTYKYTGLTPGPISNPGLSSIKAALSPAESGYYYYVLDPSVGEHHFSVTLEEHNAFRNSLRN